MRRKYNTYNIIVEYLNGDKETINYEEKGVDNSSYKSMLKVYKEIKDQYKNENVTIKFIGCSEQGSMNVFFEKNFKLINENEDYDLKVELSNMQQILIKLSNAGKSIREKRSLYDLKQDVLLHDIEALLNKDFDDLEDRNNKKLTIYNNLEIVRLQRRNTKNDQALFDCINSKIGIEELKANINNVLKKIENKNIGLVMDKTSEEYGKYKEVKYRTEKERIQIMSQLNKNYNRITYNNGVICCFNTKNK